MNLLDILFPPGWQDELLGGQFLTQLLALSNQVVVG
jgi:hypothetical protein